jgi:hypothetical protein
MESVFMKPRAVRIPLVEARVTFNGSVVRLVNISRSGALVAVASAPATGSEGSLTVSHAYTTITIDGRVVRSDRAVSPDEGEDSGWQAAIVFTAPPPDEITALLRRVVSPRLKPEERVRV